MRLPAEEHVLDDVQVVAEREVLVDDLDAERGRVARAVDRHRLALEEEVARVDRVDPADALDQGGLAGAVVTDERGDLAGVRGEVDARRTCTGPKLLFRFADFQQGCRHVAVPHSTGPVPGARGSRAAGTRRGSGLAHRGSAVPVLRCRPRCTSRRRRRCTARPW